MTVSGESHKIYVYAKVLSNTAVNAVEFEMQGKELLRRRKKWDV
jgi:hypothetical protein